MTGRLPLVLALAVLTACTAATPDVTTLPMSAPPTPVEPWPSVPAAPRGDLEPDVTAAVDRLLGSVVAGTLDSEALDAVAASGDARLAWLMSDLLRFVQGGAGEAALVDAFAALTGTDPRGHDRFGAVAWLAVTNLLIGWDLPAPPDYLERKATLFLAVEPRWEPFFADADATLDWRWVSWGGVFIDDRPVGDRRPCARSCIPALDDPALIPAAEGDWYSDDRVVFGVVVEGEAVAFPKHIMEVHEMVNLTIGGRRIGMPYCTLCGSAQAYLTDAVPEDVATPILRTSGLLSRSNKVMYDLETWSILDTFTGRARSGPLADIGLELEQVSVVVSTWGEWKAAHPDTRIVARDGGIGRAYPDDPLGGRDDDGPIFPIGPVDTRLPAQTAVVGVIGSDGAPVAFPVDQARSALAEGRGVTAGGVELLANGGGFVARAADGSELAAHQAFWFAWSQFHPDTLLWSPIGE